MWYGLWYGLEPLSAVVERRGIITIRANVDEDGRLHNAVKVDASSPS